MGRVGVVIGMEGRGGRGGREGRKKRWERRWRLGRWAAAYTGQQLSALRFISQIIKYNKC